MNEAKARKFIDIANTVIPLTAEEQQIFTQLRKNKKLLPKNYQLDLDQLYTGQPLASFNADIPGDIFVPQTLINKAHRGLSAIFYAAFAGEIQPVAEPFFESENPYMFAGIDIRAESCKVIDAAKTHEEFNRVRKNFVDNHPEMVASFMAIQAMFLKALEDLREGISRCDETPERINRSTRVLGLTLYENCLGFAAQMIVKASPHFYLAQQDAPALRLSLFFARDEFSYGTHGREFNCPAYAFLLRDIFKVEKGESLFSRVLNTFKRDALSDRYDSELGSIRAALGS